MPNSSILWLKRLFKSKSTQIESPPQKAKKLKTSKDPFILDVGKFAERLQIHWASRDAALPSGREIAFLVTPWLSTPVPLFMLELALHANAKGNPVRLIFDRTDLVRNAGPATHGDALQSLLKEQLNWLPTETVVDSVACQTSNEDLALASGILRNNAIWWSRGETFAREFEDSCVGSLERIARHLAVTRHLLQTKRPARLVIPGGIFGISSIYRSMAADLGIPYTSFDSGPISMIWSNDSVAAHREDLSQVVSRIDQALTKTQRSAVEMLAQQALEARMSARDAFHFQTVGASGHSYNYDILLPLNIRWDAAALGRERVFVSFASWLEALMEWVEKNPPWSLCIRDHPAQRLLPESIRSRESFDELIARFEFLGERLRFISATEEVNTYDLVRSARVILPFTSTIGIEAAMFDKPSILSSHCYYNNIGFAWPAETEADYFELLTQALEGELRITPRRKELARLTYYVTELCCLMRGKFNPHPEAFREWVCVSPAEMETWDDFRLPLQSILEHEDVPMLVHQERMKGLNLSPAS